jgi:hypothetical protein
MSGALHLAMAKYISSPDRRRVNIETRHHPTVVQHYIGDSGVVINFSGQRPYKVEIVTDMSKEQIVAML